MTTANLGMTLPTVGADADTWGGELNTDLGLIDTFAGSLMPGAEVTVASASTTDIGAAASTAVAISGTTTITSLGTGTNKIRFVRFTGASLVLTYNATSLILPRAANIQTGIGDTAIFQSDGSGNWRCLSYMRAASPLEASNLAASVGTAYTTICSFTLTPGKWRMSGNFEYSSGTANNFLGMAINTTANASTGAVNGKSLNYGAVYSASGIGGAAISGFDITVSINTIIYLNAAMSTNASTGDGYLRAEPII